MSRITIVPKDVCINYELYMPSDSKIVEMFSVALVTRPL